MFLSIGGGRDREQSASSQVMPSPRRRVSRDARLPTKEPCPGGEGVTSSPRLRAVGRKELPAARAVQTKHVLHVRRTHADRADRGAVEQTPGEREQRDHCESRAGLEATRGDVFTRIPIADKVEE